MWSWGRGAPPMRRLADRGRAPVTWSNGKRRRCEILCDWGWEDGRCAPSAVSRGKLGPVMHSVGGSGAPLVHYRTVCKLRHICSWFRSLYLHLFVLYINVVVGHGEIDCVLGRVGEKPKTSSFLLLLQIYFISQDISDSLLNPFMLVVLISSVSDPDSFQDLNSTTFTGKSNTCFRERNNY